MSSRVKLSGKSDMKGRNGYTKLDHVEFIHVKGLDGTYPEGFHIDFCSKRSNLIGAARLVLSADDFDSLRRWFAELEADHE